MTDFEYDSYLKKNIAHSAARRKGGSKSKKCSLSTDHMSNKQWKERCGEVMSYQLGGPMKWPEFCSLPNDLKEEYLNSLIQKYSANARGLADMFGVSVATVFRLVKKENLNVQFIKGRHPSGERAVEFLKFVSGETSNEQPSEPEENVERSEEISEAPDGHEDRDDIQHNGKPDSGTHLDSFSMSFSGDANIDMIANSLKYIIGSNKKARIQIVCEIERC